MYHVWYLYYTLHRDEDEVEQGDVCTTCASCFAPEGRGWTGLPYKPDGEWMRKKYKWVYVENGMCRIYKEMYGPLCKSDEEWMRNG